MNLQLENTVILSLEDYEKLKNAPNEIENELNKVKEEYDKLIDGNHLVVSQHSYLFSLLEVNDKYIIKTKDEVLKELTDDLNDFTEKNKSLKKELNSYVEFNNMIRCRNTAIQKISKLSFFERMFNFKQTVNTILVNQNIITVLDE